jgi:integrase
VATQRARRDPSADLRGALPPANPKHFASITDPRAIGDLLRAIDGYRGGPAVTAALRIAPLVFVRPGELRRAEWAEIDLDGAEWRIPAEKMKMGAPHIVPLSRQAVAILRDMHSVTGSGHYVFPSVRTTAKPISENTVNAALRALGYSGDDTTRSLPRSREGYGPEVTRGCCLTTLRPRSDVTKAEVAAHGARKLGQS